MVPSASRTSAVGKYLVALSRSLKKPPDDVRSQPVEQQRPSDRRRQLYILYLLNDLLHHTKYHGESSAAYSILTGNLQSFLVDLFGFVSAYSTRLYTKHHQKIQEILDIWDGNGFYQTSYVEKLRETVVNAARLGYPTSNEESTAGNGTGEDGVGEEKKDAPYIMPASHGDASIPYYDLPAANMLPHIMPHLATPINPLLVKPLQFMAGPADEMLVTAVKDFLRNVESLDEFRFEDEGAAMDVDKLGQFVVRDDITGGILEGDGYYGWSRAFCERMRRRGDGSGGISKASGRDQGAEKHTSSRKRRYSNSAGSMSRSRSRSSSVRSRQDKRLRNAPDRSDLWSRSRSRSPSRAHRPYRSLRSRSHSRSMSRSSSYSPPPIKPPSPPPSTDPRPLPRDRARRPSSPQLLPPFVHPFVQNIPLPDPGVMPIPPPPPPNYTGPWPPPPPPMVPDSKNAGYTQPAPPLPPPTGPRIYQSNGPSSFQQASYGNAQSQMAPSHGSWDQQQQHPGPGGTYAYASRGRASAPFISSAHNTRGRGFEQGGGWNRS